MHNLLHVVRTGRTSMPVIDNHLGSTFGVDGIRVDDKIVHVGVGGIPMKVTANELTATRVALGDMPMRVGSRKSIVLP